MNPVLPVFFGIAVQEQVAELRSYLKLNGANLEEDGPEDLSENLAQIFAVCSACTKSCSDIEMQGFLNSILSLILTMTEKRDEVIRAFLNFLIEMPHHTMLRHNTMSVLFCGLNKLDPIRYDIYCAQLRLASTSGLLLNTNIDQVKTWLSQWDDVHKSRNVYRLMHDCFEANEQREEALEMMIELLKTYPESSEAKDDAVSCIVSFIDRPNVWIMDHLLDLGPVKHLKGELIYQMLEIFVRGNINDYNKFYEENSNFVDCAGFNHERNVKKMRILSFVSLVNKHDEITFEKLAKELSIDIAEVESFIIEVLKTRLVRVRVDEVEERIITSSAAQRTFDAEQWKILQHKLQEWKSSLKTVKKQIADLQPL